MPTDTGSPLPRGERQGERIRQRAAFAVATLTLVAVIAFINGCGDDDLVFPGQIPNTSTPGPATVTATPIDGDEDDEL